MYTDKLICFRLVLLQKYVTTLCKNGYLVHLMKESNISEAERRTVVARVQGAERRNVKRANKKKRKMLKGRLCPESKRRNAPKEKIWKMKHKNSKETRNTRHGCHQGQRAEGQRRTHRPQKTVFERW